MIITVVVALAMAPFVAVMVTSFTKIVVVLSLLRNALGLQQVPPNVVLNGLAIILSVYVMNPVIMDTYSSVQTQMSTQAPGPMTMDKLSAVVQAGKEPLRQFLIKHSHATERDFFLQSAKRLLPPDRQADLTPNDYIVIMPAFTVSELTQAFQIGFLLFLPFLVIDLVVANILLAMGMMMLSPTMVSLPFKLLLFILLSGWAKLVHGLVLTYQ
nr:type III secretion system export apparatus subunit SctR [Dyella acidiphila]